MPTATSSSARPLALVTGASTGIGAEFARRLAADGHDLVLVARSYSRLERLAAELRQQHGIRADVLAVDLTLSSSVQRIADALGHRLDEVAVLINNAGFGLSGAFVKQSEQELVELMQLNMTTLVQLCRRVLPGMQARRSGRILNVSSTAAFQPGPGFAVYCATKSFVLSFSEALAHEVRGLGITVTCLAPGPVETERRLPGDATRPSIENSRSVQSHAGLRHPDFSPTIDHRSGQLDVGPAVAHDGHECGLTRRAGG